MASTIVWTTLPAGIRRDHRTGAWLARVSLAVSPRLDVARGAAATLSDFPPFLDWPRAVGEMAFRVRMSDGARLVGDTVVRPASPAGIAPDSRAWRTIFGEDTPVRAFDPPEDVSQAGTRMLSYDSRGVVREVRDLYARTLAREVGLTTAPLGPGRFASKSVPGNALGLEELLERWSRTEDPLERFALYHCRVASPGPIARAESPEDAREFHRMLGALGTHPSLLRRLGLVLEFTLPAADLALDAPIAEPRLRIEPVDARLGQTTHACHWTAVEYDPASRGSYRTFTTAHEGWVRRHGLLLLGGDRVSAVQEQHEHAAFALMQHQDAAAATGESSPLPALLQGAMRLTHADAAISLSNAMRDQARLDRRLRAQSARSTSRPDAAGGGLDEAPLFAEQLTRGYRIDVRDADEGPWRSLCRRLVRYEAAGWSWPPPPDQLEEEGSLEPSAQTEGGGRERWLRSGDGLFEWDGWSLVVPRPGKAVDGDPPRREPGLPLTARFEVVPGSLQRQRFGRRYLFRARLVDLAGNSLAVEEADAVAPDHASGGSVTAPIRCVRVESVKPPVLVRAQPRGPGEAGDVVVLRDAEAREHRTIEVRLHVLPPAVPLRLAERHGVFDDRVARESWRLIRDHRGELPDEDAAREIHAPYLPDPMVRRAVLVLPDGAGSVELPAFDDLGWRVRRRELARSCGLVVRGGRDAVRARVKGRNGIVEVPRGRVVRIRLAPRLSPADLAMLAPCEWLGHPLSKLVEEAARGRAPSIAPTREITIVHATQRPVAEPRFGRARILPREPDATSAALADEGFRFDAPSSGRIDVYARWDDPVDDPQHDGWRVASHELHAAGAAVSEDGGNPLDPRPARASGASTLAHDFGDTKHHEVRYRAVATSRFVAFYPGSLTRDPAHTTRTSEPVALHVPATAPPAPPEVAYVVPTFRRVDSPSAPSAVGDVYHAVQVGDGLRVFMGRGWFSSGRGERLALVVATPRTPPELREDLSTWGANPLRDSAPLPGPLELDRVGGGWRRIDDWRLEAGAVGLVIHDVQFSQEHAMPFADIEFLPQPSYMPFVRLALARHQEHAIEGCELSRIVHADFVPLTPGRSLTVRKTGPETWSLVLGGYSYRTGARETSVVRAQLELMSKATPEEAAAWRPLGEAVSLEAATKSPYHFQWFGELRIDDARFLSDDWRRRLVVREYEPFETDGGARAPLHERARLISAHAVRI